MEYNYFGNIYRVSEDGVVTSHRGRVLSHQVDSKGYHRVVLQAGRKHRLHTGVHRLVALTHLPNPDNKPEVNHKDGDKDNNHVSNLEWCTSAENVEHSVRLGLAQHPTGFAARRARLTPKLIADIHRMLGEGVKQTEVSKMTGISQATVSQVKHGKRDWYSK